MIETWTISLGNGIDLSCRAAGRRGDPVLVFLHGFPEAAFVWDQLLEHFADRYRCVAVGGETRVARVEAARGVGILEP